MVKECAIPIDPMRGNAFAMNGRTWRREYLGHVAKDCRAAIFFTRVPTKKEVEHLIAAMRQIVDAGAYDDEREAGAQSATG